LVSECFSSTAAEAFSLDGEACTSLFLSTDFYDFFGSADASSPCSSSFGCEFTDFSFFEADSSSLIYMAPSDLIRINSGVSVWKYFLSSIFSISESSSTDLLSAA